LSSRKHSWTARSSWSSPSTSLSTGARELRSGHTPALSSRESVQRARLRALPPRCRQTTFGTAADSVRGVAAVSEALWRACGVADTDSELNKQWSQFHVRVDPLPHCLKRSEAAAHRV
jgi:hypothetical protein